jgi:hypothetical protein
MVTAQFHPQRARGALTQMKKTVWTFGLISGAIISILMLAVIPFHDAIGFDRGLTVGYTTMVLAFLLVYFGVRSYRDNVGHGSIGFGRALAVGSLIALISSVCYVATWELIASRLMPDYLTKYQAYEMNKMAASGASQAVIAQRVVEMQHFAELYKNPFFNAAMTFIEPLPVGLVIAFVSAAVLRRRRSEGDSPSGVLATG